MSVQALSWVLTNSQSRLAARLVLLAIANHANESGYNAWPSVPTIGREAHITDRQVQRAIRELCGLGELVVFPGSGPARCNVYRVVMDGDKLSPHMVTNPPKDGDKSNTARVTNNASDGDKSGDAIRKNRPEPSKSKPSLNQNQNPPTPLEKGGGVPADVFVKRHRRLTKAEQRRDANLEANRRVKERFRQRLAPRGPCDRHPDSGLTNWGTCWGCYSEQYGSERPNETGGTTDAQNDDSGGIPTTVHASDTASRTAI